MPDITMCVNKECPLKNSCHRQTAVPHSRQSYADFKYDADNGCEHYWEVIVKKTF